MKNKCLICGGDTVAIMKKSLCDACYPNAISAIYEKQCILLNAAQATACAIIGALADKYPAVRFTPTKRKVCYNGRCEFGLKAEWLGDAPQCLLLAVRLHTDDRGVWREIRLTDKKGDLIAYLGRIKGFADLATMTAEDNNIAEWLASYYDFTDPVTLKIGVAGCRPKGGDQS